MIELEMEMVRVVSKEWFMGFLFILFWVFEVFLWEDVGRRGEGKGMRVNEREARRGNEKVVERGSDRWVFRKRNVYED